MHKELIRAHLRMKGHTPASVADELGVCRTAVAYAIDGRTKSQRIRARVAEIIGLPQSDLWPETVAPYPGVRRRGLTVKDKAVVRASKAVPTRKVEVRYVSFLDAGKRPAKRAAA